MKKATTLLLALIMLGSCVFSETKPPRKKTIKPVSVSSRVIVKPKEDSYSVMGKNFLDPGVGLGTYYKGLPFGVSFEHGFTDKISAGVFVNYSSYSYADIGYKLNIVYFGVRGSYHFAELFNVTNPKFDPYGGVSLGYYNASFNGTDIESPYSSTVFFGVHAGVRYLLSDNVGVFGEVGYGVSALQVGVSFKF
jgi:hypothetical protein